MVEWFIKCRGLEGSRRLLLHLPASAGFLKPLGFSPLPKGIFLSLTNDP